MNSITIIVIVVVAILTIIIFGLTWLSYLSCLKLYKLEVNQGKHDKEIYEQYHKKKSKLGIIGTIVSYISLVAILSLFTIGLVYKVSGENFSINNQVVLVIKTRSMAEFYDDEIALEYHNDRRLQFDVGDICVFEKISINKPLVEGEVYGYRNKNNIITHRLKSIKDSGYEFRGDNNPISDYEYTKRVVSRDRIIYHYTGKKVKSLGTFVLYAQSYFGLWSLVGILGVITSSEIINFKISKINKERDIKLGGNYEK